MVIYLIRHARQNSTDCNVNVPLSAEGRKQAELLGKRMNKYKIDALYSSDLIRAVETAKIAFKDRKELSDNIIIRPGIAEVSQVFMIQKLNVFTKNIMMNSLTISWREKVRKVQHLMK